MLPCNDMNYNIVIPQFLLQAAFQDVKMSTDQSYKKSYCKTQKPKISNLSIRI